MKDEEFAGGIADILAGVDKVLSGKTDLGHTSGIDYRNDVFETRNFWAHSECQCDFESLEWDWEKQNDHAADCYQSRLKELGFNRATPGGWERKEAICDQVCREFGIDPTEPGQYVHCTCDYYTRYKQFRDENKHTCEIDEPNFRHYASGLEVWWYKRVGRSTESNIGMTALEWYRIVVECLESLKEAYEQQ